MALSFGCSFTTRKEPLVPELVENGPACAGGTWSGSCRRRDEFGNLGASKPVLSRRCAVCGRSPRLYSLS